MALRDVVVYEVGDLSHVGLLSEAPGLSELKKIADLIKKAIQANQYSRLPKGILLFGEPGTGKTLGAQMMANELQIPMIYVSSSSLQSPVEGGGARNVSKLFQMAKDRNSVVIILLDEFDAIASSRVTEEGINNSGSGIVQKLLTELDGPDTKARVITIANTNHIEMLDKAIARSGRFDKHIHFEMPNTTARKSFFEKKLKALNLNVQVDLDILASITTNRNFADLNAIFKGADEEAFRLGKPITTQLLLQQVVNIVYGVPSDVEDSNSEELSRLRYKGAAYTVGYILSLKDFRLCFPINNGDKSNYKPIIDESGVKIAGPNKMMIPISNSLRGVIAQIMAILITKEAEIEKFKGIASADYIRENVILLELIRIFCVRLGIRDLGVPVNDALINAMLGAFAFKAKQVFSVYKPIFKDIVNEFNQGIILTYIELKEIIDKHKITPSATKKHIEEIINHVLEQTHLKQIIKFQITE